MGQVFGYISAESLFDNEKFDKKYDEALIEFETVDSIVKSNGFLNYTKYLIPSANTLDKIVEDSFNKELRLVL